VRGMRDALTRALPDLPEALRPQAEAVLAQADAVQARIDAVRTLPPSGCRTRIHGDYHLGQVLVAKADLMIIDFEGEPHRSLDDRRRKGCALRDVAGMLRSLDYAAWSAWRLHTGIGSPREAAAARLARWRRQAETDFLSAYEAAIAGSPAHPADPHFARAILDLFLIRKAAYEVGYELSSRPAWVEIPLSGLLAILEGNDTR